MRLRVAFVSAEVVDTTIVELQRKGHDILAIKQVDNSSCVNSSTTRADSDDIKGKGPCFMIAYWEDVAEVKQTNATQKSSWWRFWS